MLLGHDMADLHNVVRVAGKRGGDEVKAVLDGEEDILTILGADKGHGQVRVGDIHALLIGDGAAVIDLAAHVGIGDALHGHADEAVVDQDGAAGLHVAGQVFIGDADAGLVALHILGGQGEQLACVQRYAVLREGADADFGALGVQHGCHGQTQFITDTADLFEALQVVFMRVMGEIEPGNVHAREH